ncbi:outer membrane receptor protein involved in Fe transport [Pseudoxanthomonas sp. SORGH_AS 997]|uniref:Outer membrane receptor protein involved in Fe transport n=2 Tax=Lysobacteraceae TaxID=32033 RepID=A0AAW8GCA0_9GAMM|nr:outer membrane receptor protein involved in Fe transport [Pseudoxanthomonas winnipegensis]MDQ1133306.1 outer membrane receptor protein involved in Fe transport [Pseudoxanthomonas winnipegensis]MDR6136699.1 outer membrane receptor protein involved in Fe transport [Pseudoxanthomonas sp. SORGH_AS_0997]
MQLPLCKTQRHMGVALCIDHSSTRGKHQHMKRILRRSALALALTLAAGSTYAQSTTGRIFGTVQGAETGDTVLVQSGSGFSREVPVEGGRYALGSLPLGSYTVTLKHAGQTVDTRENVSILVGAGTEVGLSAGGGGSATTLGAVKVSAMSLSPIDVSSVDTRTVVTAEQLQQLPLGRNAEAIALLAPGVVVNSGGFDNGPLGGSLPSFGGSAASENAYYLNGFNTTSTANNLGGLTLPYGAIDQQEVIVGGYGAQYGRSNGGVISQIGKSGTNEWKFGASAVFEPEAFKASQKDIYWRPDSQSSTVNNTAYRYARAANGLYQPLSETKATSETYSAYVGGPIIQDKLFFFLAGERVNSHGTRILSNRDADNGNVGGLTEYEYQQNRLYGKVNWYITDNHLLELTGASDKYKTNGDIYRYNYITRTKGAFYNKENTNEAGPRLYLAKYTGYFGDNVTVSALYGQMNTPDEISYYNYDPGKGPVINSVALQNPAYNGGTPIVGAQKQTSITAPDREYEKRNLRLSVEWRIGDHAITAGVDNQKLQATNIGTYASGPGYAWTYGRTNDPYGLQTGGLISQSANEAGGKGAPSPGLVDPTYGASGYYVTKDTTTGLNSYDADQKAYYLEDKWQVTDNVLLSLGLRKDEFTNYVPISHVPYISVDAWSPRVGFSWDVHGDSSLKIFGNVGRYYLGLPLSAVGLFTANVSKSEYFTYSGINPDGTPIVSRSLGPAVSANSRFGRASDPSAAVVKDIKGENQDEVILGFSQDLSIGWTYGVRAIYRRLNDAIDDQNFDTDNRGLVQSAAAQGVAVDWTRTAGAELINPGKTNVWNVYDTSGNLRQVTVTREAAGFPELKRDYGALEFNLERPFDGKWYTKMNYVWSHSYGTTEGQLRSDLFRSGGALGSYQGQAAVSTTQSWDHAALMEHVNGDQSNDHRHQIKMYGYYQLTEEWGVSGNLSMISGAPKHCLGNYYGTAYTGTDPAGYGGSSVTGGPYHYCYNPATGKGEPSPPGSHGRLPWVNQFDLGLTWKPVFADGKLAVSLNVFNLLNAQKAITVYPFSQLPDGSVNPLYGQNVVYQTPRYARLTASYDW